MWAFQMDASGFMPRLIPTRSNFKIIMNSVYHLSRGIRKWPNSPFFLLAQFVCERNKPKLFRLKKDSKTTRKSMCPGTKRYQTINIIGDTIITTIFILQNSNFAPFWWKENNQSLTTFCLNQPIISTQNMSSVFQCVCIILNKKAQWVKSNLASHKTNYFKKS